MIRRLTGDEAVVLFSPRDQFTGVDADWLVTHLRLDPAASPVDLMEGSLHVYLDDEPIEDLTDHSHIFGDDSPDETLASCSDGDAGIIGGTFDLTGEWMHFWAHEIADLYTWVGTSPDQRALAMLGLSTDARYWEPQQGQTYSVDSSHLDSASPDDRAFVLGLGSGADVVILNGVRLKQVAER